MIERLCRSLYPYNYTYLTIKNPFLIASWAYIIKQKINLIYLNINKNQTKN